MIILPFMDNNVNKIVYHFTLIACIFFCACLFFALISTQKDRFRGSGLLTIKMLDYALGLSPRIALASTGVGISLFMSLAI